MRKILIIFICFCLLFPVNIIQADLPPLISQLDHHGFSMDVGEDECIAQKWKATDFQLDVNKISLYITSEFDEGVGLAGIALDSPFPPFNHDLWLNYTDKPLGEMEGWVDFNVYSLVAGGEYYWLLFKIFQSPGENATVHGGLDNPYEDGTLWFYNGTVWEEQIIDEPDMAFEIYGNEIVLPGVQTLDATHIEDLSAELWGQIIDDGNDDCEVKFELKDADENPIVTDDWDGSYYTDDKFYEIIPNLNWGTKYFFRAGARNDRDEEKWGDWISFTMDLCDYIPEYHAVLFYPFYDDPDEDEPFWKEECDLLKSVLESQGWTNIYNLSAEEATEPNLISTLQNLSDDSWDTTLIVIASHGSGGGFLTRNKTSDYYDMTYKNLSDEGVDHLESCGIAIVVDACRSGSALWDNQSLKQDGRVIMTSWNATNDSRAGFTKYFALSLSDFGDYKIGDDPNVPIGDGNGAVSMNETYYHIKNEGDYLPYGGFLPMLWEGYPTEENPDELHITFQNWSTGRIDQLTNVSVGKGTPYSKVYNRTGGEVRKLAQSFIPQFDILTKVSISMRRTGGLGLNSSIKVEIWKGDEGSPPGDEFLGSKTICPDELDPIVDLSAGNARSTYITFDFDDDIEDVATGETHYILIEATNLHDDYEYKICAPKYNRYLDGCCYRWNGSTWDLLFGDDSRDIQFVTYGLNSSNMPPYIPKRLGGPDEGYACVSYDYNVTTTDMDGDKVRYQIDWGDKSNVTGWEASGDIIQVNHMWESSGVFFIKVKAEDYNLQESNWSDLYVVNINSNNYPIKPSIDGLTNGNAGKEYEYTFNAIDPDGDNIKYFIDWGDDNTEWTDFHASGTDVKVKHTWSENGTYNITAKAKDVYGAESEWGYLEVTMPKIFGYTVSGTFSQNIKNKISGSKFTILANGTANNITAYIQTNLSTSPKTKCMIYRNIDSTLIGTTEEKILNTGDDGAWVTYNFSDPKPTLVRDTEYVLACWSNDTCNLSYDNATSVEYGRYRNQTYGDALDPINWTSNESRIYSIYCRYTTKPEITGVSATPISVGFGFNVTISASVNDNLCGIENVSVNITYPNNATGNFTMDNAGNDTYEYVFSDTWLVGQYNYTIWVFDNSNNSNSSSGHSFNVSAQANISVCTIKDEYGNDEMVNLTDPPCYDPPLIGYELLDDGDVLHMWNEYNSYYFNTSSGIQLTNHYDEYWSHNVLMLGYYNNNKWNLIYRTDELSGFNKDIDTDNETYVNATLWKDLTYGGYDFRLAVRYHLGADDFDLTVIPYIKNLGQAIPYTLGFGWEIKDIKIADTYENDSIRLYNGTDWISFRLNQTLDNTYTNMDYNTTFYLEGRNEGKYFRRTLYLKWNHTLDYLVQVKSRTGQYNAPVTLFIKIGTLDVDQEKYTELNWLDSDSWLGVDSRNYHSCCGYEGPFSPMAALDGTDIWLHLTTEDHWVVVDLKDNYNVKKVRGRSDTGNDPTSVDIYISDDANSWAPAVVTGITTWQDTSNWVEVDITDTVGRYINISITSTEGGAGVDYLEFGKIPTPMTIFDVYGEKVYAASYYFNSYNNNVDWATNPSYMVDGSTSNYASTILNGDVEQCTGNTCSGTNLGTITKVELRAYGYYATTQRDITLIPVFGGSIPGNEYIYQTTSTAGWSSWFNITDDNSAPNSWSWTDVADLDCEVHTESGAGPFTLYCSKVEVRVVYDPVPVISNPVPADGSTGVSLTPTLNITVSDSQGDNMTIAWLSNSSGSWQSFGTNVTGEEGNGTYHQIFSNATVNGQWWYWRVNVSDGTGYNISSVYKFYTGCQSKIENTGSTYFKGYLLIQVQYYNTSSSTWVVADDTVNESSPRTITLLDQQGGNVLALDTIFNGLVNTSNLSEFGNGTYRIYAAFRDPDGNILVTDDETELVATYEFTITFD